MYVVEECKGINFLYVLTSIPALEEKIFHNFSYLEITWFQIYVKKKVLFELGGCGTCL